jgi:hypothetical protein
MGKCIAYDNRKGHKEGIMAANQTEWESRVKGILKAELKRRNVTYADLVDRLATVGVVDSEPNIRNKISRGKFTAVFFLQCLTAIGVSELRLN